MIDYNEIDIGVREVVRLLNENGFNTTDSGDGSKFGHMDGALPFKHVVIVTTEAKFFQDTYHAYGVLVAHGCADWTVEASLNPADGTHIILCADFTDQDKKLDY